MSRQTQHLLLFLLGGMLIRICLDGTYLRYVRPGHLWPLVTAGLVAVALALAALWRDARVRAGAASGTASGTASGADTHEHGGAERYTPWLLMVPVLVILLVSPPALGADAVARAGSTSVVDPGDAFPPLPPDEPDLTVGEFAQRATWDTGRSLDGRTVALTGFVVRRDDGTVELARLTIVCCAADARVNRVRLRGDPQLDAFAADTWLRVRGTLVPSPVLPAPARSVPVLTVGSVEEIPAPADAYEY